MLGMDLAQLFKAGCINRELNETVIDTLLCSS